MKELISEAFISLVEKNKTYKISIEQICQEAHISKPTLYNYFPDKLGIIEYIFNKEIIQPMENLSEMEVRSGKPNQKELQLISI